MVDILRAAYRLFFLLLFTLLLLLLVQFLLLLLMPLLLTLLLLTLLLLPLLLLLLPVQLLLHPCFMLPLLLLCLQPGSALLSDTLKHSYTRLYISQACTRWHVLCRPCLCKHLWNCSNTCYSRSSQKQTSLTTVEPRTWKAFKVDSPPPTLPPLPTPFCHLTAVSERQHFINMHLRTC